MLITIWSGLALALVVWEERTGSMQCHLKALQRLLAEARAGQSALNMSLLCTGLKPMMYLGFVDRYSWSLATFTLRPPLRAFSKQVPLRIAERKQ